MADFMIIYKSRNMINGAVNSCISHMAINTVLLLNVVEVNKEKKVM